MLSDHERRTLDALAVSLAREDPELARDLRDHLLAPPHGAPRPDREPPRSGRRWRVHWPPVIMIAFCLALLILPGLVLQLST